MAVEPTEKSSVVGVLGCIAYLSYLALGFVQWLVAFKALKLWLELPTIGAFLLSMVLAFVPLVGQALAVKASMAVWGWGFWFALIFFCWPTVLVAVSSALGASAGVVMSRFGRGS